MRNLKVLSYNIHKGFGSLAAKSTLSRMRAELRIIDPDIIFLQEVMGHDLRKSQFEYLAEEVWPHFSYGKNAVYAPEHHGNAILSRYPILGSSNIDLSTNRFERRGLLHAIIQSPAASNEVHAFSTHLNLLESGRQKQLKKIISSLRNIRTENMPIILAGDFNDWRESGHEVLMNKYGLTEAFFILNGHCARTFPSLFPLLCLDRIYFQGLDVVRAEEFSGRPWSSMSDHLPILAEFKIST